MGNPSVSSSARTSCGATRRQFLKTAAGVGLAALAPPLVTACGGGSSQAPYGRTISAMTAHIQARMAATGAPGHAIALVDGQRVVWAKGFGYADVAAKIPATADTVYEIGSVSKVFTACLVMQLAEEGKLSLDDALTRHIPEFAIGPPLGTYPPGTGGPITIRSMLTHHSGIPGDIFNGQLTRVFSPDFTSRLLDILKDDHAHYPTDFFLMYSNTAVALLADVLAAASGQTFENRSDTFFRSLGMTHTSFSPDSPALAGSVKAKGYYGGTAYGPYHLNAPAAGGMLSSVLDMARFIQMVNARGRTEGGRALSAASVEAMLTRQSPGALDFDFPIGLMWRLYDPYLAYAGRYCGHGGDRLFMLAVLKILPDHDLGVIVLANSAEGGGELDGIANRTLELALEEKTGIKKPSAPYVPIASERDYSWSAARLNALAGIYSTINDAAEAGTSPGSTFNRIKAESGGLLWMQKGTFRDNGWEGVKWVVPRKNGWFSRPDSQEYQYEFKDVAGRTVMIEHREGRAHFLAERYVPAPIPAAWAGRLGKYTLANLDPADNNSEMTGIGLNLMSNELRLEIDADPVQGDVLVLRLLDGVYQAPLVVAPVSDSAGYMPGGGRNFAGAVKAVPVGGEEQLQFLGLRYRKI